jgi:phenylacetate-CoA ligase
MHMQTFLKKRKELRRNKQLARPELMAVQLAKFRDLVRHVAQHSPYYQRVIREGNIDIESATPDDFPVLTKAELLQHFDDIVTDRRITRDGIREFLLTSSNPCDLLHGEYYVVRSSGSSGETGYFVFSRQDWSRGLAQVDRTKRPKWFWRKRKVAFIGAASGHFAGITMLMSGWVSINKLLYDFHPVEVNRPLGEVVTDLNQYQPDILVGYPTVLGMLAERQEAGSLQIAPYLINCSGEPVSAAIRSRLERTFDSQLVSVYASSEHMYMGVHHPGDDGMWLLEDDLIFEPAEDHVCVTNLFNRTLPLIRYRMNDALQASSGAPTHGPYQTIREVVGRQESAPVFLNKSGERDFISPSAICEFQVDGVERFQMHIRGETEFTFKVCLRDRLTDQQRADTLERVGAGLRAMLEDKNMGNVRFIIEPSKDLYIDPATRKFPLVIGNRRPVGMSLAA